MARRRAQPEELAREGGLVVLSDPRRPGGRLLLQDDMEASYVDLADERHVEFDYLRRLRDLVEVAGARDVLHVGGAACALARALAAGAGGRAMRQEVVEADPAVLEVARRHLGLRRTAGLRVRVGDGRAAVARRAEGTLDAVLVDAFVGARVPRHLVTREAVADVRRVLRPDGVVAVNVVDVPPLHDVRAVAAALAEHFATVAALGAGPTVRARRGGNVVVVGGPPSLALERLRAAAAADPSPAALVHGAQLSALVGGVAPWTD
ncbi:spermidine synthase [Conexibacter sp. SYSU D00693]|uniref:spermidine synthase n=1 Tax=Conexibacter sp. SYSU D00693 TaxID=2812560 RepID=UPI00196B64DD|nr:fused MFS/spermidine synthase [Conexibacter sp. SYSU D00693]